MNTMEAPTYTPTGLELGLLGIGGLLGLVALVLGIVVAVKMLKNGQTVVAVISMILMFCTGIGHFIALIFGWMKSREWNIKGLMTAYTVSLLLSIGFLGAGYAIMLPKLIRSAQQQMQQLEREANGAGTVDVEMGDGSP